MENEIKQKLNKKIPILIVIADIALAFFSAISAVMIPIVTVNAEGSDSARLWTVVTFTALTIIFIALSVMCFIYKKNSNKKIYYSIIITNAALLLLFILSYIISAINFSYNAMVEKRTEQLISKSNELIKPIAVTDPSVIHKITPSVDYIKWYREDGLEIESYYNYRTQDIYREGSYIDEYYIIYNDAKNNLKFAVKHTKDGGMEREIGRYLAIVSSQTIVDEIKSKMQSDNMVVTSVFWNENDKPTSHFYEYNVVRLDSIGRRSEYKKFSGTLKEYNNYPFK